jgi:CotH kinase protein
VIGWLRRWGAIAAAIIALIGLGLLVDAKEAFPLLRVAVHRTPALLPSTIILPREERRPGIPVVSLYVSNPSLWDLDRGILSNRLRHGKAWERQGFVSFFDGERLTFSGSVGVRIHGGGSRYTKNPQGFRLFFRKQYGLPSMPARFALGERHDYALKRVILHNDMRVGAKEMRYHLTNPLAYEFARALGNITPATRPVRFYLNGFFQDVYVVTEHFDPRDYFSTHIGHPALMDDENLDRLWDQVRAMKPMRMREVSQLVDIENLTRWFIAVIFCGTHDAFQGPGQFMDPYRKPAPWFWVAWDMDESFRILDHDTFDQILESKTSRRGRRDNEPRPRILTGLLKGDPEYREYFKAQWVDAMNHVLTPEFVRAKYEYYAELAVKLGVPDTDYLPAVKRFLDERPAVLRTMAAQYLQTGPMVQLRMTAPGTINGHQVDAGWTGYYFPGMTVQMSSAVGTTALIMHADTEFPSPKPN